MTDAALARARIHAIAARDGRGPCTACGRVVALPEALTLWRDTTLLVIFGPCCMATHELALTPRDGAVEARVRDHRAVVVAREIPEALRHSGAQAAARR